MALGQVKSVYLTAGLRAKGRESNDAQIIRAALCRLGLQAVCSWQPGRNVHLLNPQAVCQALYKQFSVIARWALVVFSLQVRTSEAQGD